jgi:sec-independent protein translocase protein TatA
MFGDIIQPTHLLFILVVALLVLGPKRLPEVGRSLGKGLRDFRGAMAGIEEHTVGLMKDEPAPTTTQPDPVAPASSTPVAHVAVTPEPEPSDYAD